MMGIIGMIQVLAARAHPIQEVYQATSNWTMPELRAGEFFLFERHLGQVPWSLSVLSLTRYCKVLQQGTARSCAILSPALVFRGG